MDQDQMKLVEELLFAEKRKPGFVKNLYFGDFLNEALFPFPEPLLEEMEAAEDYLSLLKKTLDTHLNPDQVDRKADIPRELIEELGKIGLLGVSVPKKYGGLGRSQYTYCKAIEEVASRCSSTAIFINAHQSIGLKAILLFGTEEQKKKWLPDLASGKKIAAFSLTEPNAGSDASGVETRAEYNPAKKTYTINGKKQWTSNGSIASVLTVMAKTKVPSKNGEFEDKVTAFIVTPDMPGFHIKDKALEKVGVRGTKTTNLEFINLEVPEENILGPLGGGLKVCLTALDYGRTTFGAMCLGAAKFCMQKAISHAVNRYQFKRPLASFPLVKKKIAEMAALVYAMEASLYLTAGFIDTGIHDVMLESAILKVFASESLWQIIYETMQIYGGRSFFTDQPFERMMRDARLNMIGEGSNEVLRAFIGAVGLRDVGMEMKDLKDKTLSHPLSAAKDIFSLGIELVGVSKAPVVEVKNEALQSESNRLAQNLKSFSGAAKKALIYYREDIVEKQLVLDRLATCAIALYTASATLSKLDKESLSRKDKSQTVETPDYLAGKYYLEMANQKIQESLHGLITPLDPLLEKVSDELTGI
ncbi:acyl-CoA dehydrogenase family protein [Criblamydia sequanensis]|nr:acyl-CoA dehydrogenase family protein [Criblamydia sequanensis]